MANSMLDEIRLAQRNKAKASQEDSEPTQDEADSVDNQTATDGVQEESQESPS